MLIALEVEHHLRTLGYDTVDVAESPSEALARAERRRPDLITADVRIRGGTGIEAVANIHAHLGDIPFFYVTGNVETVAAQGVGVVDKPIDPAIFARIHAKTLEARAPTSGVAVAMRAATATMVEQELATLRTLSLSYAPVEAAMRLRSLVDLSIESTTDALLTLAATATDRRTGLS